MLPIWREKDENMRNVRNVKKVRTERAAKVTKEQKLDPTTPLCIGCNHFLILVKQPDLNAGMDAGASDDFAFYFGPFICPLVSTARKLCFFQTGPPCANRKPY